MTVETLWQKIKDLVPFLITVMSFTGVLIGVGLSAYTLIYVTTPNQIQILSKQVTDQNKLINDLQEQNKQQLVQIQSNNDDRVGKLEARVTTLDGKTANIDNKLNEINSKIDRAIALRLRPQGIESEEEYPEFEQYQASRRSRSAVSLNSVESSLSSEEVITSSINSSNQRSQNSNVEACRNVLNTIRENRQENQASDSGFSRGRINLVRTGYSSTNFFLIGILLFLSASSILMLILKINHTNKNPN